MTDFNTLFAKAREDSRKLPSYTDEERSAVLLTLAGLIETETPALLAANAEDLAKMSPENPLYDRLQLTAERLKGIASDMRHVAKLPCPVGEVIEKRTLENGIELSRVRSPFGVVGVIYEARPNVTFDVFAITFKTANACILKGGHDAEQSNRAAINLIKKALRTHGMPEASATLLPSTHEATGAMLCARGYIDICIPRGGRRLIDFVRDTARIPVIETGAGVVHAYFHSAGDLKMGSEIINNAKTRRISVCNALDTLIVDRSRLNDLPTLLKPLADKDVTIHADREALEALEGKYPAELLKAAVDDDAAREWMSLNMGVYTVGGIDEALEHISRYGSGHSETIITEDSEAARRFMDSVDAACVYHNLPTSFTDGGQFGLGAEIGISTQKLGPRGPMGLTALTTYRWLLVGRGQLRP